MIWGVYVCVLCLEADRDVIKETWSSMKRTFWKSGDLHKLWQLHKTIFFFFSIFQKKMDVFIDGGGVVSLERGTVPREGGGVYMCLGVPLLSHPSPPPHFSSRCSGSVRSIHFKVFLYFFLGAKPLNPFSPMKPSQKKKKKDSVLSPRFLSFLPTRRGPPPGFSPASTYPGIVHHLSGPNKCTLP